jgi:exopolysaccharide production protein ExoF
MRRVFLCLGFLAAFPTHAEADLIAPADVLELRVTDWLPVDGELREWSAISGTYTVGPDGRAAFPYVGEIPVAGLSPLEIGDRIGEGLKQRFALADTPFANVSIAARRPVLVGGVVRTPGEVSFTAGMTARHAIAQAGGLMAADEASTMVQMLTAAAQVRILSDKEAAETLRIVRLRAELDGTATLPPVTLPQVETLATLRADAERLLALRQERLKRELELIDSRIALLEDEIVALGTKQTALERQRALAEEVRQNMSDLAERGLAANVRLLDAEETLVTVETQVLDVSTALLRARQLVQVARSERLELVEGRAAELMQELETAEVDLAETRERLALHRSLAGFLSAEAGGTEQAAFAVTIYRTIDGKTAAVADGPDSVLQPGDLVEVTLPIDRLGRGG